MEAFRTPVRGAQGLFAPKYEYSAFTVAELGDMLPEWVTSFKTRADEWCCAGKTKEMEQMANTEADARAKMLCYLLENKLMDNPTVPQKGS